MLMLQASHRKSKIVKRFSQQYRLKENTFSKIYIRQKFSTTKTKWIKIQHTCLVWVTRIKRHDTAFRFKLGKVHQFLAHFTQQFVSSIYFIFLIGQIQPEDTLTKNRRLGVSHFRNNYGSLKQNDMQKYDDKIFTENLNCIF